jgi:sugar phosphate isomerase/epimerase
MNEIINNLQVHIPFRLLAKEILPVVIEKRINPEISFNFTDLETTPPSAYAEVAKRLSGAGLRVTFHAPFMDLRPGALDQKIRQATKDRLQQLFDLVPFFHPVTVVCHPSFDERYYVSTRQAWLENSIATWSYFLKSAEAVQTIITLENVYETEPSPLLQLLGALSSSRLRFCFDTGHFNVFSRAPLADWIEKMAPYLVQLHVHDNAGAADDHSPVGKGNFPFRDFFARLQAANLFPLITLEPHSLDDLWQSLQGMATIYRPPDKDQKGAGTSERELSR